jgi:glycosyl transferase family 9 (putative heptosyltransferase)
MGYGDQIIATGLARGAANRGRKVAFGAGGKLLWDKYSRPIFHGNPNIAQPGQERGMDVEWIPYYKGRRGYNQDAKDHWVWNMNWKCVPGEIFFTPVERHFGETRKSDVVIEPNAPAWKSVAPNKDWGFDKYQEVCTALVADGYRVIQPAYNDARRLEGAEPVITASFRDCLALIAHTRMFLGPEGGLHHGAAAVGKPAVVLFGGFIPPKVTGYDMHKNMVGSDRFCGSYFRCQHCVDAMAKISAEEVLEEARSILRG